MRIFAEPLAPSILAPYIDYLVRGGGGYHVMYNVTVRHLIHERVPDII